jgi:hypothetical protein
MANLDMTFAVADLSAKPDGTMDNAPLLRSFITRTGTAKATIYFQRGTYRIAGSLTFPQNMAIKFELGAALSVDPGTTVTVNGPIEAGIWPIFLGAGTVRLDQAEVRDIYPQWFGAMGNGSADDTAAFNRAMDACNFKRTLYIPSGAYMIRDTIINKASRIAGETFYLDGGRQGVRLLWRPTALTDLKPCLLINQGSDIQVENLTIEGGEPYSVRQLAQVINKSLMEKQDYAMFAAGSAGITVEGKATVRFQAIKTGSLKAGVVCDNDVGHISFLQCNLAGLCGVFLRHNTGDFFFMDGTITGAFCGILLGRSGIGCSMKRIHMGFAPYSFYQVNLNRGGINGLNGCQLEDVRFERTGECAIKLLPNTGITGTTIKGFGFNWSVIRDDNTGWYTALPDELAPAEGKQKYAIDVGSIGSSNIQGEHYGGVFRSPYRADGRTLRALRINGFNDLSGIPLEYADIGSVSEEGYVNVYSRTLLQEFEYQDHSPVRSGQLLKDADNPKSWKIYNGTASILTDWSEVPAAMTERMRKYYGGRLQVIKITPNGNGYPKLVIDFAGYPNTRYTDEMSLRFFGLSTGYFQSSFMGTAGGATRYLYTAYARPDGKEWAESFAHNQRFEPAGQTAYQALVINVYEQTNPSYITVPMATVKDEVPYSPTKHASIDGDLELAINGAGLLLRAPGGKLFRVTVNDDGTLGVRPFSVENAEKGDLSK